MITDDDMKKAIDRIASTEDGYLLYLYFQKTLCSTVPLSPIEGALQGNEGRRKYAAELMDLMSKGIAESGGSRTADRRPVIFARQQPSAGNRHVSAREYLRDHTDEPER